MRAANRHGRHRHRPGAGHRLARPCPPAGRLANVERDGRRAVGMDCVFAAARGFATPRPVASPGGGPVRDGRARPVGLHGGRFAGILERGDRTRLGLPHADAWMGRLCLADRGGHLVGCLVADRGRCGRTAAGPDPHGRRVGPRGGHPGRAAGAASGLLARPRNSFGRLPPSRWPAPRGPRWPSGGGAKDGPSRRRWA